MNKVKTLYAAIHDRSGRFVILEYSVSGSAPVVANRKRYRFIEGMNEGPCPTEKISVFCYPALYKHLKKLDEGEQIPAALYELIADLYAEDYFDKSRRVFLEYDFETYNSPGLHQRVDNVIKN